MEEKMKKIADYYGLIAQLRQLNEECCELAVECNHAIRGRVTNKLVEELADVEILLEQIKYLCHCSKEMEEIKEYKVGRQIKRIEKENNK